MKVESLPIPDVKLISPKVFRDERGSFCESWSRRAFAAQGVDAAFVQDNHAVSSKAGTIRGLHFQAPPHAQGKLVRVLRGAIFDVAVDIRQGSPDYGRHVSAVLSADNALQIWIPEGFAHGYATLEPDTEVLYKVTDYYAPGSEGGVAWNDPALGIAWPIDPQSASLSEKDLQLPLLRDIASPFSMPAQGANR